MAETRVRRGRAQQAPDDNRNARIEFGYVDINDLQPYPYNPRDNSGAIEALANSIKAFGFLCPVVVDAEMVLVAGHTRVEAAKLIGLSEVPMVKAEHLSEDQINAFRIIDNKVAEIAEWDFDLLSGEINKLHESGIDFTAFGWTQGEIDCLTDVVASDCMNTNNLVDDEQREQINHAERRTPTTARMVLGELVFFVSAQEYRTWVDSLRAEFEFDDAAICEELKRRLGI